MKDKRILITGGATGIGAAAVRVLHAAGAGVAVVAVARVAATVSWVAAVAAGG